MHYVKLPLVTRPRVLKVAVNVPLSREFDYLPPTKGTAAAGSRVRVPFGRRQQIGLVLGEAASSDVPDTRMRRVAAVLDVRR